MLVGTVLRSFLRGRHAKRTGFTQLPSSKYGNKDYYKGKGGRRVGHHTKKGGYVIDPSKVPEYQVPDLAGFKLKPYISWDVPKNPKVAA